MREYTEGNKKDMDFTNMTEIHTKTIPPLLEGRDLISAAKTVSGKILAFLIPTVELIYKVKFMPCNGKVTICIVSIRKPFQYFLFYK